MVPRAEKCETRYVCYMHAQYVHGLPLSPHDLPATSDSFSSSFGLLPLSCDYRFHRLVVTHSPSVVVKCLTLGGKQHVSKTFACSNNRNTIERASAKATTAEVMTTSAASIQVVIRTVQSSPRAGQESTLLLSRLQLKKN